MILIVLSTFMYDHFGIFRNELSSAVVWDINELLDVMETFVFENKFIWSPEDRIFVSNRNQALLLYGLEILFFHSEVKLLYHFLFIFIKLAYNVKIIEVNLLSKIGLFYVLFIDIRVFFE